MTGIGHNGGPTLDRGLSYRRHCWTRARAALLPRLPVEVVRSRVRRAAEIGLDYRVYAQVRAATGRDIVAFLFSTNALRLFRDAQRMEPARIEKLQDITGCDRRALAIAPLRAADLPATYPGLIDSAAPAPPVHAAWSRAAAAMDAARGARLPADAVLLVGDTTTERDWSLAGRLAGYLEASRFFTPASG